MPLDLLTFGEALVEVMRTAVDQPLNTPGPFVGPYPSGAPFIFTVQAARLGARAAVIGSVGDDAFGRCLLDQLRADDVDMRGVRVLSTHTTGVAFISYRSDGSRDFVFHMRHAAAGQLAPDMLDRSLFAGLRCLHVTGSALSIYDDALKMGLNMLEWARAEGAKISFDLNIRPQLIAIERARAAFAPFLEAADVILATPDEACLLAGRRSVEDAARAWLDANPACLVVIHRGKDGCSVYAPTRAQHVPGFPIDEVDATGAGDCFDAGFLVRWLAGDSPIEAARFANACGALAVAAQGPMAGAQTLDVVQAFMRERVFNG